MPIKIILHKDRCNGHARCVRKAPDVYRLDERGFIGSAPETVPAELEDQAIAGAGACPEEAIEIVQS
ncbi:MAG: ferredoxin [Caulobacteraceae bacterium]|nr:ferredoxin [Caulobacteraceae bacterium]